MNYIYSEFSKYIINKTANDFYMIILDDHNSSEYGKCTDGSEDHESEFEYLKAWFKDLVIEK